MSDALYLFLKTFWILIFFFAENFIPLLHPHSRSDCNCMLEHSMIATLKSSFLILIVRNPGTQYLSIIFSHSSWDFSSLDMMSNFALPSGHSRLWDSSSYLNLLLQHASNPLKFRIRVLALLCELRFKYQFSFQSLCSMSLMCYPEASLKPGQCSTPLFSSPGFCRVASGWFHAQAAPSWTPM